MKRVSSLFLAAALLVSASSASGQTTFSVHGGVNLTVLSNEIEDSILPLNYLRVIQPQFGLSATYRLTPEEWTNSAGIQLNGTYAPRGADVSGLSRGALRLNYLEMAVLLDVRVPLIIEPLVVHLLAGPAFGWLMSCEREKPCSDGEFRSLDYGLSFGGNLEVGLTDKLGLMAGFQYNAGLSYADAGANPSRKNRTLALRGGLLFPIG